MIDINRIVAFFLFGIDYQKYLELSQSLVILESDDICFVNGKICQGQGETVGAIMNSPKDIHFDKTLLLETIKTIGEIDTDATKFAFHIGIPENIILPIYHMSDNRRYNIKFFDLKKENFQCHLI